MLRRLNIKISSSSFAIKKHRMPNASSARSAPASAPAPQLLGDLITDAPFKSELELGCRAVRLAAKLCQVTTNIVLTL